MTFQAVNKPLNNRPKKVFSDGCVASNDGGFCFPFFSTYEACSVTLAHWNVPKIVMVLVMLLLFCC